MAAEAKEGYPVEYIVRFLPAMKPGENAVYCICTMTGDSDGRAYYDRVQNIYWRRDDIVPYGVIEDPLRVRVYKLRGPLEDVILVPLVYKAGYYASVVPIHRDMTVRQLCETVHRKSTEGEMTVPIRVSLSGVRGTVMLFCYDDTPLKAYFPKVLAFPSLLEADGKCPELVVIVH